MNEKFKIQYSVDQKDFINFRYTNFMPDRLRTIGQIIMGILVFCILTNKWLWKMASGQAIKIDDFSSVMIFAAIITLIYFFIKRQYKASHIFQNPMFVELSKDEVIFEGHGYSSNCNWSNIYKVKERKNYFVIFTSSNIGNIISKSKLSGHEIDALKKAFSTIEGLDYTPLK